MVIFTYLAQRIDVIRTFSRERKTGDYRTKPRKPESIGRFQFVGEWLWDAGRASLDIYRTLDHSEKRQIIGMMDALNGLPIRAISDMRRRWEEIIGPAAVEHLSPDNVDWKKDISDAEPIHPMDR